MVYKVSSLHPLSLPTPFPGASSALFQCICKLCTHSLALWIILHKWHLTILIVLQLAFSTAVVNYVSRNEKRRAPHPQFQWSVSAPLRPRPLSLDRRLVPRPLPWPAPRRAASAPARPGSRPQVWRDNPSRPARAPTGQKGPLVFSTVPGARAPRQVGGWRKAPRQRRLIQPRLGSGEDWMKERVQDVYAVVKGKGKERNHRVLV